MKSRYTALLLCGSMLVSVPGHAASEKLTLDEAVTRALAGSPRLQSSDAALLASEGARLQAGALPNPELEVSAENIGGQNQYRGFSSAEVTYGASQTLEIGGKRSARMAVAERGVDIASYDHQAMRLDIIRDVTRAYVETVAAGEEVKLAEGQRKLAGEVLQTVNRRVNAAREPLIQQSKAKVALSTSGIALDKAKRDYQATRQHLSALTGGAAGELDTSAFYNISEPAYAKEALEHNPDMARWKPTLARSEAALLLEEANAVPDPKLSAGIRDFRDTGDKALVASISIPFPVFDSNRGNIARARAEVRRTASEQKVSEMELGSEFVRSLEAQRAAYTQASTLKKSILPEAEKAFALSRRGYQEGSFTYLEVLDAERTLAGARAHYIEALREYHLQRTTLERLTGAHITSLDGVSHDQK